MKAGRRIAAIAVLCAALPVSSALAKSSTTKAGKATKATVTVTAPAHASHNSRISLRVVSVFAVARNGAENLTVFLAPPGTSCPSSAKRPNSASSLLSSEPADRVLIANLLSDRLTVQGQWTVCSYLTKGSKVTAAARAHVQVG
jgi:hypothetical protein